MRTSARRWKPPSAYADGLIRDSTVSSWYRRTMHARNREMRSTGSKTTLYQAVIEAALPNQYFDRVRNVHACIARARGGHEQGQPSRELVPLLQDIFGNPFHKPSLDPAWLAWDNGLVRKLAQAIYDERAFERLPILADALEDAGCADADLLNHCRQPGMHVRGCWVIDLLTERA